MIAYSLVMLALEGVHKSYRGSEVLHGVDLRLDVGTTVVIGPSGSGKSTLLRLLAGLELPDAGRVIVGSEDLAPENLIAHRRRLGYVIQEGGLFPHLTARQNVMLMARSLKRDPRWIGERVGRLTALTHLDEALLDRYPGELSGGERQRIALIRALMLEPEILLLDEPLGALDPLVRFELMPELASIFESLGNTVVFVTHDLDEAAYFADRLVLLHDGIVGQSGSFEDLLERPANDYVREFIRAQRPQRDNRPAGAR